MPTLEYSEGCDGGGTACHRGTSPDRDTYIPFTSIQSPQLVLACLSGPCLLTHHAALLVASICVVSYIQAFVHVALSVGNLLPLKSNHYSPYKTLRIQLMSPSPGSLPWRSGAASVHPQHLCVGLIMTLYSLFSADLCFSFPLVLGLIRLCSQKSHGLTSW